MSKRKYFTKSVFKLATECPVKPYYYGNKEYENVDSDNEFLKALAEGGFQVGELAKAYYPGGYDIETKSNEQAIKETNELLKKENVVIYEAAITYKDCLIRVDVLEKIGNTFNVIEVKSKSFDSQNINILSRNGIKADYKPYILDIAFQNWVVKNAFPDSEVNPFLMLADKSKSATIDGLNQKFYLTKENGRTKVVINGDLKELGEPVLTLFDVSDYMEITYNDTMFYDSENKKVDFNKIVLEWADKYVNGERLKAKGKISDKCFKCQFRAKDKTKKSGFLKCFKDNKIDIDESRQLIDNIWNYRGKNTLLKKGKFYIDEVEKLDIVGLNKELEENDIKLIDAVLNESWNLNPDYSTINEKYVERNLTNSDIKKITATKARQWKQIEKVKENDIDTFVHKENLKTYVDKFNYPLHFIDFETSMVAIPFFKGQKLYEQMAFQFSHHIMDKNGKVEHKGEFLFDKVGEFPNFEFVRALKKELENDNGTIFRYAPHENTVLNQILNQLYVSNEKDKFELINFIKTITYGDMVKPQSGIDENDTSEWNILTNRKKEVIDENGELVYFTQWVGERNMVDMLEMVKNCYYSPDMKGSNSIKAVLPSVLKKSKFVQDKYSKPIYGKGCEINSLNFESGWNWIRKYTKFNYTDSKNLEETKVVNPYKFLPNLFENEKDEYLMSGGVANGAEAMTAYAKMQFTEMTKDEREKVRNGLLRYCELDTLAMVMIMEYWMYEVLEVEK
jgi:hypothetical protein